MDIPHFPHRQPLLTTHNPRCREEDIVAFARRLGFEPDPWQQHILRSTARRGILNCARQSGKSTVSVIKATHRAFTVERCLIVVGCPGERQSGEWMEKADDMLARLGIKKRGDGHNNISRLLPNGSRIVGLPDAEARVRGFSSPCMIVVDEAARVSEKMYLRGLRPMLSACDGDIWLLSTPCGKRGFFYEAWERGGPAWERMQITAEDCPRISPAFLEEQRSVMDRDSYLQEHMCTFIGGGRNAFDPDLIDASLIDDPNRNW